MTATVASRIEEDLINATFGHVLRLPIGFFGKRASGALAKRIDQSDQVAPIVTAFAQEIAPEALRIVGVVGIMLTQSLPLTAIAVATLPAYSLRRAAIGACAREDTAASSTVSGRRCRHESRTRSRR